jgi:hypothetical protein
MTYNGPVLYTESVSAVTATNSVSLGSRRTEGGNDYVYVYNAGGTPIIPTYGAILSANSAYSITISSALGDRCAGVVKHTTMTTGTYGWLCTRGPVTVQMGTAAGCIDGSLGNGIALQTNGAFASVIVTAGTICTGQTCLGGQCGVATTALITASSGQAFLHTCTL